MWMIKLAILFSLFTMLFMGLNSSTQKKYEKATFAGGCFWCMEPSFEKLDGVVEVMSGYTGGKETHPTYEAVSTGETGHLEAVQIIFDPAKISYSELLDLFWKQIDPTDANGQFVDRGPQYKTAIFYHSKEQKTQAEESIKQLAESGKYKKPIVTEIIKASPFYKAEDYHQGYYKKNPVKYKSYRRHSGRDQYIKQKWGREMQKKLPAKGNKKYTKPSQEELRKRLTPLQFMVTQENDTERAFDNAYWNNKRDGIYVDIVSGESLFCSFDKYDSGTGWPSFTRPLEPKNIIEVEDKSIFRSRTEVRSKHADSHLGHVFPDGPKPTGLRYCINSAALRFIEKENLQKEGYGEYIRLFENQ